MARVRLATLDPEDAPEVLTLQERVFADEAGMTPWQEGQLARHARTFPEGQHVAWLDDRLVAAASSLRVPRERALAHHTWMGITGGGDHPRHNPAGDCLYGTEIMIDPEARGLGLAKLLYRARKVAARSLGLWGVAIAGRMCGYREAYKGSGLGPEAYVEEVERGKRDDPVLSVQLSAGFQPRRVLPGYIRDPEAMDHAVLLVWQT